MRGVVVLLCVLGLVTGAWASAAAAPRVAPGATPAATPAATVEPHRPPLPGQVRSAWRDFEPPSSATPELLVFDAIEFGSEGEAAAAVATEEDRRVAQFAGYGFKRVDTTRYRDETRAYAVALGSTDEVFLVVRDGRYLVFLSGGAIGGDVLGDLVGVAGRLFARLPPAAPGTDPAALLPRLADLPPGWVVRDEGSETVAAPSPG
jgi:hypothetical protein